jgi:hypothetical protein
MGVLSTILNLCLWNSIIRVSTDPSLPLHRLLSLGTNKTNLRD